MDVEETQSWSRNPASSTSSSSITQHIPQVTPNCKPELGKSFDSLDKVLEFYNEYAKEGGFSVRINSSRREKGTNEIIWKSYVCSKEGITKFKPDAKKKRHHPMLREGCSAKLTVVKCGTGYSVSAFVEGHSHLLTTPDKVQFLRSHRNVSEGQKALSKLLSSANIPTHTKISLLAIQAGGIHNIGCTERDFRNFERDLKNEMKGHDGDLLDEHFKSEKEQDPSFSSKIEPDSEDRIARCFWADAKSKREYNSYGDVVVFDTTYNTNRYGMIFAPLVGVNNHGQTVVFGCAFLNDETTESFIWLFEEWMKAMPGGPPKMIITDQDPAMEKAIAHALPTTLHRNCIWHILDKFSTKLGAVKYKEHYAIFHDCIWNSETREKFDTMWMEAVVTSESEENSWLDTMYERRFKWVPAYVNHVFSAGMSSSQRAESGHSFFKKYISKNNSLMDFMVQFGRALARQRNNELNADHQDSTEKPVMKTPLLMEEQMVKIYTRTIFSKFQDELWNSMVYTIEVINENEDNCVYKVMRADTDISKFREVFHDKSLDFLNCSCKRFESQGIICRHILAYFNRKQILYLPNEYILPRWTRVARCVQIFEGGREVLQVTGNSLLSRHNTLTQLASNLIDDAALSEEASVILTEQFKLAHEKITVANNSRGGGVSSESNIPRAHTFDEPDEVRAKGCGKRLKGGKEREEAEGGRLRLCNGCGQRGLAHDKRNCPALKSR